MPGPAAACTQTPFCELCSAALSASSKHAAVLPGCVRGGGCSSTARDRESADLLLHWHEQHRCGYVALMSVGVRCSEVEHSFLDPANERFKVMRHELVPEVRARTPDLHCQRCCFCSVAAILLFCSVAAILLLQP